MPERANETRAVMRLTSDFILRWAETWLEVFLELEYLVVYTAILQANVRNVARSHALNLRYGETEAPPDALRDPISLRALAAMLGMPRETVRRKVAVLEAAKSVQRIDRRGFIVPARLVMAGDYAGHYETFHRNVKQLYRGFCAAGLTSPAAAKAREGCEKFRLTMRLVGDFILDWVLLTRKPFGGEAMLALVFSAVLQTSLRGLEDDAPLDDGVLRPIPVHALAVSMKLPPETVRRYVRRLEAMAYIVRVGSEGVIVPARAFEDPTIIELAQSLRERVSSLFEELAGYGVALSDA